MEHKIWNREMECADRETKNAIQLDRLKKTVETCYNKVPFYKKKFDEIGLRPEHIKTLADVKHIPFTTAEDLRNNYPFGLFAVPKRDVVRIHGSSGTTGKPKIVGYTKNDLENWSEIMARVICATGGTADDIVQIAFGYGLFTGGFGLHYGMEKIGAMVVPLSSGNTDRQIMLMQDFQSTILIATPSYALYLADEIEKKGIDKDSIKLRLALFGGEGHTEEMRAKIEKQLGILATENYGLSEIGGPGYSGECYLKRGLHIAEDQFISEIIDPDTLEPLPIGDQGELVVTTLTKDGLPDAQIQDERHHMAQRRALRMRQDIHEDAQGTGQNRRHDGNQRSKRIPFTDRVSYHGDERDRTVLRDHRHYRRLSGQDRGARGILRRIAS